MPWSQEVKVKLILLWGNTNLSFRQIEARFKDENLDIEGVTYSAISKVLWKFKETGSVHDKQRSGRPSTEDYCTQITVLGAMCNSPTKSLRRASQEFGVTKSTIHDILQQQKWHPYKLQLVQKLTEDDPDRREGMCDWFIQQCEADDLFLRNILFSDEAIFYFNDEVNKQNSR